MTVATPELPLQTLPEIPTGGETPAVPEVPPCYVEVVFPTAAIDKALTYRVPGAWRDLAVVGSRVMAPLRNRTLAGVVTAVKDTAPKFRTADILDPLDPEPLLTQEILDLAGWVAEYYLSTPAAVIRTVLPPGINDVTRRVLSLTPAGEAALAVDTDLAAPVVTLLKALTGKKPQPLSRLYKAHETALKHLPQLVKNGWVLRETVIKKARVRPQTVTTCHLAPGVDAANPPIPGGAKKQRAILQALIEHPAGLLPTQAHGGNAAALAVLVRKGLVSLEEREVSRDPFLTATAPPDAPQTLSATQTIAVNQIVDATTAGRFQPFLLYGVTGSGKTEVYLQAIDAVLARGQKALLLVPEISLTPLAVSRFLARFGTGRIAVLHSGLSDGERLDAWRRIRTGGADVVIGARSAVFAPLTNLGLIVVDEEHDTSYKQDENPRYHGRDVAIMRAKKLGIPVVLGSATPSFESYERATSGRYTLLSLPERIAKRPLPTVRIIDLRQRKAEDRMLTPELTAALGETLAKGEQALLFLNRRGYHTVLLCNDCGHELECPHCSSKLTYHQAIERLRCHLCTFSRRPPDLCPLCQSRELTYLGTGTQQVEAEVKRRFPAARVARLDRDTAKNWRQIEAILKSLQNGETQILVGTQMLGKGHDVPGVTLVGVITADSAISLPDFRAAEHAFSLLTQVVGRAGRGEVPGTALIQSYNPEHYILGAVITQDFGRLWAEEHVGRQHLGLPPFGRAALIVISSESQDQAEAGAQQFARQLGHAGVSPDALSGPAPAPLFKLKNRYRWHILVHESGQKGLHAHLRAAMSTWEKDPGRPRTAKIEIDIDPTTVC